MIYMKIEEQQWVVSSLSGGARGSEACGAWEARLRAARALLRATHHAQRRYSPDTLTGWPYTGQVIEGILQGFIEAPTLMFCHTSNDYKEEYEFKIFQKY